MQRSRIQAILGLGAVLLSAGCSGAGSSIPTANAFSTTHSQTVARTSPKLAKTSSRVHRNAAIVGPNGFSAMRVTFTKNTIADEGIQVANFAKQYGVSTIFLQVAGDDIAQLEAHDPQTVANLNAMFDVANVYIMTGDPTWLNAPTTVPSDVTAIIKSIAPAYPRFAGILYNIEPLPTQTSVYFQLLDTLLGGSTPYTFGTTILDTNPSWRRLPNRTGGNSPSMLQQAESYPAVSATYFLMRGRSAGSQMSDDATKALPQMLKPYWSGADVKSQQGNSYLGQSASTITTNLTQVASQVSALNPQILGVSVDEWDDAYAALMGSFPQPTPAPIAPPNAPLMPAPGQSYVGAYINPNKSGFGAQAVAAFESSIGRKLAYDLQFIGFTAPFINNNMRDDAANGRVPLIAWQCGDSDARVAAGSQDAQIKASAAAAAAYGKPIFLRYLWEMNLPVLQNRNKCWDPATDRPGRVLSPAHFIAAFRHMHDLFVAAGATNVIWVWCESGGGPNPAEYYPGDDVVDWVGIDNYNRTDAPFSTIFAPLLNSTSQYKKPIMIAETGADPGYQPTYFPQIATSLQSQFPLVKAVSYFDGSGIENWTLSSAGISGFAAMAQQQTFAAMAKF